jgi:hypothetical protein
MAMRFKFVIVLVLLLVLPVACGSVPSDRSTTDPTQSGSGGLSPESVTRGFFEDLGRALKDPALGQEPVRTIWVERLSGYFAPNERDTQRDTLDTALANFADGRSKLGADETLSIEIRFDEPRSISNEGDHALVQLPNASIFMQISRLTDRGPIPYYEQPISLDRVIGRADGSVPTIRIGNRWFLTEG